MPIKKPQTYESRLGVGIKAWQWSGPSPEATGVRPIKATKFAGNKFEQLKAGPQGELQGCNS